MPSSHCCAGKKPRAIAADHKSHATTSCLMVPLSVCSSTYSKAADLQEQGVPLASDQIQFSLLYRKHEKEGLLKTAKQLGVSVIGYSPLSQGLLTGELLARSFLVEESGSNLHNSFGLCKLMHQMQWCCLLCCRMQCSSRRWSRFSSNSPSFPVQVFPSRLHHLLCVSLACLSCGVHDHGNPFPVNLWTACVPTQGLKHLAPAWLLPVDLVC